MSRSFTISVYKRKRDASVSLTSIGVGAASTTRAGSLRKVEEQIAGDLRKAVQASSPAELQRFDLRRGTRLERVHLEITLKGADKRKLSGLCPIIVEPRYVGEDRTLLVAYHPARQLEWFPTLPYEPLAERAAAYFSQTWAALDDDDIRALFTDGRDSLAVVSFDATPKSLLDQLPERKKGVWDDLETDPSRAKKKPTGELKVLPKIAVDVTVSLSGRARDLGLGLPRSPYREELETLFGTGRRRSIVLVGPPGSGKSTMIRRLIVDTLATEGFATHKNLDKVTRFYRISGKTIIAGMSRVGDWEQRCVEICDDVRGRKTVLLVTDLHLFGRIGKARDSERALSDFFRGPVTRGELTIIAECTQEALRRLEEDDPAFAAAFSRFRVAPTSRSETFRMMLARARELEAEGKVTIAPNAYETILELGAALYPAQALPGKAVDLLTRVAGDTSTLPARVIQSHAVIEHLSSDTGLPWLLLSPEKPLDVEEVRAELASKVMGQEAAIGEAADLVVRIRAGLTDPKKPWGVYLFTGPTGTGKTELAKALAEYLYGSTARLQRFDMSELSGPDAVARLIGDTWEPEGLLTKAGLSQPFGVVLLDEIEKAHPSVLNLLLQLFDEGRLTDADGKTASFTHSVIVMTSNLGARRKAPVGFEEAPEGLLHDVARAVREFFPPELFNRIDAVVPFSPLTPDVAVEVTQKALNKLFSRSGLVERSVFVEVEDAAVRRIAKEALRAEDGARSLTRFIEDRIGTLLVDHIARAPSALQVVRVMDGADGLRIHAATLTEAEPVASGYALSELWTKPLNDLRAHLPEAIRSLDRIESSDRLVALCERLRHHLGQHNRGRREHGAPLYNLEWMRVTLSELRDRIERLVVLSRDSTLDEIETALDGPRPTGEVTRNFVRLSRLRFRTRRAPPTMLLGRGTRWEAFSAIAETYLLSRAIGEIGNIPTSQATDAPSSHPPPASEVPRSDPNAVLVSLVPFGKGRNLFGWMARAYAHGRGELDVFAAHTADGVVEGAGRESLALVLDATPCPDVLILKMVGLCMKDYLELETGTHVWHPYAREPELLRVEVTAADDASPRDLASTHAERLDMDTPWLPIVRTIRFDPPRAGRPATLLELDDHGMGTSHAAYARDVADVLGPLWLLRVSRISAEDDATRLGEERESEPSDLEATEKSS